MRISVTLLLFFVVSNATGQLNKNIDGIWVPEKLTWPKKQSPYYKTKAFRTYIFKDKSLYIFVSTQRKHNYKNDLQDSLVFEGEPGYEFYRGRYTIGDDSLILKYQRIVSNSVNPKHCLFEVVVKIKNNKLLIDDINYSKTVMYDKQSIWEMKDYIDAVKDSVSCVNCKCPQIF